MPRRVSIYSFSSKRQGFVLRGESAAVGLVGGKDFRKADFDERRLEVEFQELS
jgi:hypothetical protein